MHDNTCIACGAVIPEGRHICLNCEHDNEMQTFRPTKTNGDRIRAMTDRQLAEFISEEQHEPVPDSISDILDWLESEV